MLLHTLGWVKVAFCAPLYPLKSNQLRKAVPQVFPMQFPIKVHTYNPSIIPSSIVYDNYYGHAVVM